jgi:hypothetical protein
MNQHVTEHRAAILPFKTQKTRNICDLVMLADIAAGTMRPLLMRRQQRVVVEPIGGVVTVEGDIKLVFALISAVMLEAAGLSSARAKLRLAFDIDDDDVVITIVGANHNNLRSNLIALDQELARLAAEAGAELDLIWDEQEGPTLLLRFHEGRALGAR